MQYRGLETGHQLGYTGHELPAADVWPYAETGFEIMDVPGFPFPLSVFMSFSLRLYLNAFYGAVFMAFFMVSGALFGGLLRRRLHLGAPLEDPGRWPELPEGPLELVGQPRVDRVVFRADDLSGLSFGAHDAETLPLEPPHAHGEALPHISQGKKARLVKIFEQCDASRLFGASI